MPPRISVALATHDGERYLEAQLESLARQTLAPCELVVNDDRSTDGTVEILEAFARRSPFPVRLDVNDERLGFGDNFLRAARRCRGELIAFCDQDDVWLDHKLERCAAAFTADDVVLAIHPLLLVDASLRPKGGRFPDIRSARVARPLSTDEWLPLPGMAMVFRAPLAGVDATVRPVSHYLPGTMVHHDEWIYMLARATGSIAFLDEPLGLYRQHGANVTGAPARRLAAAVRELRTTGWDYYAARRRQAHEAADLFASLGAVEPAPALRERYAAAERTYRTLEGLLARRLPLYAPGTPRRARVRALARVGADRAYRSRFGARTMMKDVAVTALHLVRPPSV